MAAAAATTPIRDLHKYSSTILDCSFIHNIRSSALAIESHNAASRAIRSSPFHLRQRARSWIASLDLYDWTTAGLNRRRFFRFGKNFGVGVLGLVDGGVLQALFSRLGLLRDEPCFVTRSAWSCVDAGAEFPCWSCDLVALCFSGFFFHRSSASEGNSSCLCRFWNLIQIFQLRVIAWGIRRCHG